MVDAEEGARARGETIHHGSLATIVVEKGAELPVGDPARKFKGRCVLLGNIVKDEKWNAAVFSETASNPATLEAARALDAYSCIGDNTASQAAPPKNGAAH